MTLIITFIIFFIFDNNIVTLSPQNSTKDLINYITSNNWEDRKSNGYLSKYNSEYDSDDNNLNTLSFKINDIQQLPKDYMKNTEEIGRGDYGIVFKKKNNNSTLAIKVIEQGKDPSLSDPTIETHEMFYQRVKKEWEMLKKLQNIPGVVKADNIYKDNQGKCYIVMEFIEGLNLNQMIDSYLEQMIDNYLEDEQTIKIEPEDVIRILRSILKLFSSCLSIDIVPNDIHWGNILLSGGWSGTIRFIDFEKFVTKKDFFQEYNIDQNEELQIPINHFSRNIIAILIILYGPGSLHTHISDPLLLHRISLKNHTDKDFLYLPENPYGTFLQTFFKECLEIYKSTNGVNTSKIDNWIEQCDNLLSNRQVSLQEKLLFTPPLNLNPENNHIQKSA